MRKLILLFFSILFFTQCTSVKKKNELLQEFIPIDKLHSDVDFTYRKLQQLHPNLYEYIDKVVLDHKFDSLKNTINTPLKPLDFYKKLSPIVAAVKQGHSVVYGPTTLFTKRETKAILKRGIGPLSQFEFSYLNDKLYVIKNKSTTRSIQPGTEVIGINHIKPIDLITEYNNFYTSDGYNTTLKKLQSSKRFNTFFTIENGIHDSLEYQFQYKDSLKKITISRLKTVTPEKKFASITPSKKQPKITAVERKALKALKKKKKTNGYNKESEDYNRNLDFIGKDSTIALLKIRTFTNGNYKRFYKQSFEALKKYQTKTLIIDLRDNGGGRLSEVAYLYSYLSDSSFVFLQKSEVVSRGSLFKGAYWHGGSLPIKVLKVLLTPIVYSYILATVHKNKNGKNYYATETSKHKASKNVFKGKIYVITNGGSFSAASILSSNLKGSKRATFVGTETGGSYNGTVAGFMPIYQLPNSHLKIRIGIMDMKPYFSTPIKGHGIYPDKEINLKLNEILTEKDPELDWILQDIKK
ncbi:S41 family peptidase [Flavobacterium sp. 7A]|uniref:S41 family peptidase n=1 Tax=Flavobacterium sp. 7A TaxID=2940571 RepID=UPI002226D20A|nr:S41 family peptidase [Flavobacterium sp. 7A]MCW2119759.1 C-terminal processing protease CtpA/Prc [Flavobacterium sp. 7A]